MHDILSPDEIKNRSEAIGLTPEALAREAGVSASTVRRLGQHDNRVSVRRRLTAALLAREAHLMKHLFDLQKNEVRA